jgi:hypothetical protein
MTQDKMTGKTQASRSAYRLNKTAICLATVAGYTDGYGLRQFNTFVSFMSGNTTSAGVYVGEQKFHAALPEAVAIFFFLVGTFLGHWIVVSKPPFPQNRASNFCCIHGAVRYPEFARCIHR